MSSEAAVELAPVLLFTPKPACAGTELPRLSEAVRFGPREYIAGFPMYLAKHTGTGGYYRLGEKEYFLLHNLDKAASADELRALYCERFGKAISKESLQGALDMFARRGVVTGSSDVPVPDEAALAPSSVDQMPTGPFAGKIVRWNPDQWIGSITPYFRWGINGPALLFWTLLIVLAEGIVCMNGTTIWKQFLGHPALSWPLRLVALSLISSAAMNVHELGHALACKRYGGSVPEMGYLFRYLNFCAYTRIDDILLFHSRLQRIYVLMIGPLISLSLIPVAFYVWAHTGEKSFFHTTATDVLVMYNMSCIVQLIPFLQLDGYFVLAQLLKMPDLRKDSYNYLLKSVLARFSARKPMPVSKQHAAYVVPIYVSYGLISLVFSSLAIAYILEQNGRTIVGAIGPIPSAILISLMLMGALWRMYAVTLPWIKSVVRN